MKNSHSAHLVSMYMKAADECVHWFHVITCRIDGQQRKLCQDGNTLRKKVLCPTRSMQTKQRVFDSVIDYNLEELLEIL